MDLAPGRLYVLALLGARGRRRILVVDPEIKAEDGSPAELEDLPLEDPGVAEVINAPRWPAGSVGHLVVEDLAAGRGIMLPRGSLPGAVIVDSPTRLVLSYLPGMRGAAGETGATLRRVDPATWSTLRRRMPDLPELEDQAAIDSWAREQA